MAEQRCRDGIRQYVVGALSTNCYALVSDGEALVVDPGAMGSRIAKALADEGATVRLIVATHRHHDHVGGVRAMKEACGAPFAIGAIDAARVCRALELSSHTFDVSAADIADPPEPDRLLHEGDLVEVGSVALEIIDAPGHTEGGIVLYGAGLAFVGDTIFAGSIGRCDLLGGDAAVMARTLEKLKTRIAPETTLLCGHGDVTTMRRELVTNPYLMR